MPYYQLFFTKNKNNKFIYPSSVQNVVWNMTVYHYTENKMIGRTDSTLKTQKGSLVELSEEEANKLIAEYEKSYPKNR